MEPESPDPWTQFLDLLSQVITPIWDDLILLLPFAMIGLVVLLLAPVALAWRRSSAKNRSRVPPRRPAIAPEGIHLPGPSPWPFVAPVGLFFIFASFVFAGDGPLPVDTVLFGIGIAVGLVGVAGWYLDANRELRRVEVGAHAGTVSQHTAIAATSGAALPTWSVEPPAGVHLPGPSPWPFFGPIGLFFVFAGLVFGPALILGGLVMALIAIVGWLRDAGSEYHQVEAGHLPEPDTRDPERAFPKRLVPLYGTVAAVAVGITLLPLLLGALPGDASGGDGGGGMPAESPDPAPVIAAEAVTSFTLSRLVVPADTALQLTFENRQDGVPHNVAILQGSASVFMGEVFPGVDMRVYEVPALAAGEYRFVCSVHPPMTGTLVAK